MKYAGSTARRKVRRPCERVYGGRGRFFHRAAIGAKTFAKPFAGYSWLGSKLITPSLLIAYIWIWAGFSMVVIGAGLAAMPRDVLEAARTDGATELHEALQAVKSQAERHHSVRDALTGAWRPGVYALPLEALRSEWREAEGRWALMRSMGQRAVRKRLAAEAEATEEPLHRPVALIDLAEHAMHVKNLEQDRDDRAEGLGRQPRAPAVGASVTPTSAVAG